MREFNIQQVKGFTIMSNYHLQDKNLSLKARGLLSTMLSLPENWDYSINGLVAILKESKKAVQSAIKELEECGYISRTRYQDERGCFAYKYEVFMIPKKEQPQPHFGCTDEGCTDEGWTEKEPQLNTKESNIKEFNTKEKKKERKSTTYDSILDSYNLDPKLRLAIIEFIKMRKLLKSPLSDYGLELLIKKLRKMSPDINMQVAILEQSIQNSWKGVFPLHQESTKGNSGNKVANQLEDSYEMIKDWVKEKT